MWESQDASSLVCARCGDKNILIYFCFLFFLIFYNLIKKEILAQVFSCKFYEIFKYTFFTEHLWQTASEGNIAGLSQFSRVNTHLYINGLYINLYIKFIY